jgi:hypothetical protein
LVKRALQDLLERLSTTTEQNAQLSLWYAVAKLAERLPPTEATQVAVRGLQTLLEKLPATIDPIAGIRLSSTVVALVERLPPDKASPQAARALRDVVEKLVAMTEPFAVGYLARAVVPLAQRVPADEAARSLQIILEQFRAITSPRLAASLSRAVPALAERLPPSEVDRGLREQLASLAISGLGWSSESGEAESWARVLSASLPLSEAERSLVTVSQALRFPLAGASTTTAVLLTALKARAAEAPGPAAGWRANAEWLARTHSIANPFNAPPCPAPPSWTIGASCPASPSP